MCIMGRGSPFARLALVGEAPGREEDKQDKPFVGRAGKLLSEALKEAGIPEGLVYIDNVVRCRPPTNRKPEPEEIAACAPYLLDTFRQVKPRVVVALGATPIEFLTKRTGVGRNRGRKIWSRFGFLVIPTWHPAYCLRTPSATGELVEDLRLAWESLGILKPKG